MPSGGDSLPVTNQLKAPDAVCLIRLSAIGDCCHTLPVVRTLQAAWPRTRITWIIGRTEFGLLEGASGIEFITFDKRTPWASLASIRRQLAGRRFPLLLHMHASMRANLVSSVVRADTRLGFDRARARDYQWLFTSEKIAPTPSHYCMDGLFSFAEHLGIRERVLRWDFSLGTDDRRCAGELAAGARPLVVISPCSSQRFRNYRNWCIGNYTAVVRHLVGTRAARTSPVAVSGLTQVVAIAAGNQSVALRADGTVFSWGSGGYIGVTMDSPVALAGLGGPAKSIASASLSHGPDTGSSSVVMSCSGTNSASPGW